MLPFKVQKKQTTKFISAKFQNLFFPNYNILIFKDLKANSLEPNEAAHNELPRLDLRCLQIHFFVSMASRAKTSMKYVFYLQESVTANGILLSFALSCKHHGLP